MKTKNRSGQTLVEFALAIPVLALILFAVIQYGFLFAALITVRNASAVGARHAVLNGASASDAQAVAIQALSPMLQSNQGTATLTTTNVSGSTAQSMTVAYQVQLIIPFVVPGSGNVRTLSATTTMR